MLCRIPYLNDVRGILQVSLIRSIRRKEAMAVGECDIIAGLLHLHVLSREVAVHAQSPSIFPLFGVILVSHGKIDTGLGACRTKHCQTTRFNGHLRPVGEAIQ